MLITFIVSTLEKGGSERATSTIANSLAKENYKVEIVTIHDSIKSYQLNKEIKVTSLSLAKNSKDNSIFYKLKNQFERIYILGKYLSKSKPTHLIAITSDVLNASLVIIRSLFRLKGKLILTIRSNPQKARTKFQRKLIYFFYRFADKIIVQTKYNFQYISNIVKNVQIHIIPNPVKNNDLNYYQINDQKKYNFLCVGRLNKLKNHQKIILAFKSFVRLIDSNASLSLVGRDDGEKEKLIHYSKMHKLEKNIIFHGETDDVEYFYKNSNIFIHFSKYEGMSNAILEALSFGLPVISSNHYGIDDIISNDFNGLLINDLNVNDLFSKMSLLSKDVKLKSVLSNNAYNSSRNFSNNRIIKKWVNIL